MLLGWVWMPVRPGFWVLHGLGGSDLKRCGGHMLGEVAQTSQAPYVLLYSHSGQVWAFSAHACMQATVFACSYPTFGAWWDSLSTTRSLACGTWVWVCNAAETAGCALLAETPWLTCH